MVNGQNDISAGDFDIFRPKFTYFKNYYGHIDKILPIVMLNCGRNRTKCKAIYVLSLLS